MAEKNLTFSYRLVVGTFRLLFRLLAKVDAKGLERTPMEGPLLIAVNHISAIEAPLFLAISPRHPISALTKREFKGTPIGMLFKSVNSIFVDRGEVDRRALKQLMRRLKDGEAFGIAPEGTRSKTKKLIEAKEGAAYVALQTNAWILPVAVWGQEKWVSDLKRLRRPQIFVRVAEPFKVEAPPGGDRRKAIDEGTRRTMHTIARMLPPEYRGFYADEVQGEPVW